MALQKTMTASRTGELPTYHPYLHNFHIVPKYIIIFGQIIRFTRSTKALITWDVSPLAVLAFLMRQLYPATMAGQMLPFTFTWQGLSTACPKPRLSAKFAVMGSRTPINPRFIRPQIFKIGDYLSSSKAVTTSIIQISVLRPVPLIILKQHVCFYKPLRPFVFDDHMKILHAIFSRITTHSDLSR